MALLQIDGKMMAALNTCNNLNGSILVAVVKVPHFMVAMLNLRNSLALPQPMLLLGNTLLAKAHSNLGNNLLAKVAM